MKTHYFDIKIPKMPLPRLHPCGPEAVVVVVVFSSVKPD